MKLLFILIFFCSCFPETYYPQPNDLGPNVIENLNQKNISRNFSWESADPDGDGVKENFITSIKNQMCGDCYIYAALGTLEIQYQIDHGITPELNLSEQNIHNCLKISCSMTGDSRNIFDYIKRYGVMEEVYSLEREWGSCENCRYSVNYVSEIKVSEVPFYTMKEWKTIGDFLIPYAERRLIIVEALQNGPVAMHLGWNFKKGDDGIYRCEGENAPGHAVVIVGYINYGEVFIVKNSHGGELEKIAFDGAEKCRFASFISQIVAGTTRVELGLGSKFCYSIDDWDLDLIPDAIDNCPYDYNPDQKNVDGDMFGDVCDPCPEKSTDGFYC